jgi:hypothetical protein
MFLEDRIERLRKRIKRIEENPRPEYLSSNKMLYEMQLDDEVAQLEAWKNDKPFALGLELIGEAMGFEQHGGISWADSATNPQKYLDLAVSKFGWPEHTCDRTIVPVGLILSGEVPVPRVIAVRRVPCDPEVFMGTSLAKYTGSLFFEMGRPNKNDLESMQVMAEQLGELVEFCEESINGIKFHEEQLLEGFEYDKEWFKCMREAYQLRKNVPCPISPQDSFRILRQPSRGRNPAKALAYIKAHIAELHERADKGIGGVREEKLRIAWLATGPYGRETFDLLIRKGVSLPWFHYGAGPWNFGLCDDYGDQGKYGTKLTPLEEVSRRWNDNAWAGDADTWIDPLIRVCRELKIDAVVDFLQAGCITTKNLKNLTTERVTKELGIPTLDLEGREYFMTEGERAAMNKRLEEFLDMCIANKNK